MPSPSMSGTTLAQVYSCGAIEDIFHGNNKDKKGTLK